MSLDTAANAVYGVEVPSEWLPRLRIELGLAAEELHRRERPDDWEDFEPETVSYYLDTDRDALMGVLEEGGVFLAALRESVGAPPDTELYYTGSEDNRLGRDDTEPETWMLGYGLYSFPRQIPPGRWKPEWHTWVEGY